MREQCVKKTLTVIKGSIIKGSMLFDPYDSDSLAQLILKVIHNERLCRELIEKGFKPVKKFSWDRTAEDILKSCEKVLKEQE